MAEENTLANNTEDSQLSVEDSQLSVEDSQLSVKEKLLSETARIGWHELQRFFAQGVVLQVDAALDLVEVATWMAQDNTENLEALIAQGHLQAPSNDVARTWYKDNTQLWSVVVAPYVLVQDKA